MKKIISVVLMVTMLISVVNCAAYAEDLSKYTVDELAYFAYKDIQTVYSRNGDYMKVFRGLWESLLDVQTWDDINLQWLSNYIQNEKERGRSFSLIWNIEKEKFKDSDPAERDEFLINAIKNARITSEPMEARSILLKFGEESGMFLRTDAIEVILENSLKDIQTIMQLDPDYANLGTLKDYYKEASSFYKYRTNYSPDFSTFSSKVDKYLEDYDSWEIDFSLIFNKNDNNTEKMEGKYSDKYFPAQMESYWKSSKEN